MIAVFLGCDSDCCIAHSKFAWRPVNANRHRRQSIEQPDSGANGLPDVEKYLHRLPHRAPPLLRTQEMWSVRERVRRCDRRCLV